MNETPMAIPRSTPETAVQWTEMSPYPLLKSCTAQKAPQPSDFKSYTLTHQLFVGISMLELISKEGIETLCQKLLVC
jgi:hypothetical protein